MVKIKAPKEVAETVEVLDAITPEISKGRGALKLLFLLPVAAGAAVVFAKRRISREHVKDEHETAKDDK